MKKSKVRHDVLQLCAWAGEQLKAMGFERVCTSQKTEAVYFSFPGRHGVLRVAAHKGRTPIGLDNVVAKLTFHGRGTLDHVGVLTCSPDKLETMLDIAIGQYMRNSVEPKPSEYMGKRGTWEVSTHTPPRHRE